MILAHRVLADVEAQEVEADLSLVGDEGVGDVGLFRVEFQPHLGQPFYGHPLQVQEHVQVGVKDDEIVGIVVAALREAVSRLPQPRHRRGRR